MRGCWDSSVLFPQGSRNIIYHWSLLPAKPTADTSVTVCTDRQTVSEGHHWLDLSFVGEHQAPVWCSLKIHLPVNKDSRQCVPPDTEPGGWDAEVPLGLPEANRAIRALWCLYSFQAWIWCVARGPSLLKTRLRKTPHILGNLVILKCFTRRLEVRLLNRVSLVWAAILTLWCSFFKVCLMLF